MHTSSPPSTATGARRIIFRLTYAHLNRVIREHDLDVLFVTGPGHGGSALLANTWLEGTYTEIYPDVGRDAGGMLRLFRQFSTPGAVPSHVAPEVPGSINQDGEISTPDSPVRVLVIAAREDVEISKQTRQAL